MERLDGSMHATLKFLMAEKEKPTMQSVSITIVPQKIYMPT
jgi:hypothetical protein